MCLFLFSLLNTAVQLVEGTPRHLHRPVTFFLPPQVPTAAPSKSTSQACPAAARRRTLFRKSEETRREDETGLGRGRGDCQALCVCFQTRGFSSLTQCSRPLSRHTAGCSVRPHPSLNLTAITVKSVFPGSLCVMHRPNVGLCLRTKGRFPSRPADVLSVCGRSFF